MNPSRLAWKDDSTFDSPHSSLNSNSHCPASPYPMAILWSPLPPLTWICPVIGHMGMSFSDGRIVDFAGPYFINESGNMAFGAPTRSISLQAPADAWDEAVTKANECYKKRMHNICCDNCHSHVAYALNDLGYGGYKKWNMVQLAFWVFFKGKFNSFSDVVKTFGPFSVIVLVIILVKL